MNIAAWLRGLGLERYAGAFADHAIDAEVLPELTEADLEKLGIVLGHRKKLLKAIAELGEAETGSTPIARAVVPQAAPREAERRHLTVLFCDLVGSTELLARLDPEDMRAVITRYQNAVAGEVARFEGHVAKFMGDGVLAYFGYPRAHEDDAERAVRAGLAVAETVGGLTTLAGQALAARIGIATGLVVVGDLVGQGAAQEEAVVGETPNLAARLQTLAAPAGVVIAAPTRRLVGDLFHLEELTPHALKGFAEPVVTWRVLGESGAEGRFEALHGAGLTPLVGRDHELALLLDRFEQASGGEGQVILLSGEAGIGKSRITRSVIERLPPESHTRLRYYCSPYYTNSALYPVIAQLERAAAFLADDTADQKLDKLEAMLGQASGRIAEAAPLVAALLSIPTDGRYPALNLTPQAQKARTFEVLLDQLAGLAARQPVLMIFEDAHWIDPTTNELFELVIDRLQRLPILLLITSRPEFTPPWTGFAHITSLTLNRLGRNQGVAIIAQLTGGKGLPEEVLGQILEKTDGVPLFVEELTKAVLESGLVLDAGDHYRLAGALAPLAIPATLHDSLMARLDRLTPVKEVAQIGAVIGRDFAHELLAMVAPLAGDHLVEALTQLVNSELLFRRGAPPKATYSFKHALIQEAAYQSLLRSKRQQLHARIAEALEEHFPDTAVVQPELLAQHYTEAGLVDPAIGYWEKAGQRALKSSANAEAVRHLGRGLELVRRLPEGAERGLQELRLQITLGPALMAVKGQSAAEVGELYSGALGLGERVGDAAQLFRVLWGSWRYHFIRAEHARALQLAERCLDLAEKEQDVALLLEARFALGGSSLWSGDYVSAEAHLERALPMYDMHAHRSLAFLFGQDPGASNLAYSGLTLWFLGYPDRALQRSREALALTEQLGHLATSAAGLTYLALVHALRRDWPAARECAASAIALSKEQGFPQHLALGTIVHGRAIAARGEPEQGVAEIRRGIETRRSIGAEINRLFDLALLAEAQAQASDFEPALDTLAEGVALAGTTGEGFYQSELYRLQGEFLLAHDDRRAAADAEACYIQALDTARRRGARSLELRAAASIARLWAAQGKRRTAYGLLAPVYGWFTEGFDTADLKDAKALLDELA